MAKSNIVIKRIEELKKQEKTYFDMYNWRGSSTVKIDHLKKMVDIITRIDELEKLNGN